MIGEQKRTKIYRTHEHYQEENIYFRLFREIAHLWSSAKLLAGRALSKTVRNKKKGSLTIILDRSMQNYGEVSAEISQLKGKHR